LSYIVRGCAGLEALGEIKRLESILPFLILSIYPEKECEVRTLEDGASGYLTKESTLIFD
jgi:CheY-like chemotaxis protein